MVEEQAIRVKRLKYRSWHRGTKELDLLLGPYADSHLPDLSMAELDLYEALMEAPEPLLYAMVTGKASPPPAHDHAVLRQIQDFHRRKPRTA